MFNWLKNNNRNNGVGRNEIVYWDDARKLAQELSSIDHNIPDALREKAWRVFDQIAREAPIAWEGADFLDEVLSPLIPYIPHHRVKQIWEQAVDEFRKNSYIGVVQHGYNLAAIAPFLPSGEAVALIENLNPGLDSFYARPKSELLIILAKYSPKSEQYDAYRQAWDCAIQSLDMDKLIRPRELPAEQSWFDNFVRKLPSEIARKIYEDTEELLKNMAQKAWPQDGTHTKTAYALKRLSLLIQTNDFEVNNY